jgi:uncharacterized membrane protein YjgN (DUF898 family)
MLRFEEDDGSVQFYGNWREFAPIAFSNLLLTVVTLGFYRFWAINRERQYLWGKTWVGDDYLEWDGTGKELFFGFLMAAIFLGLPLIMLNFGISALLLRGYKFAAFAGGAVALLVFNYVVGVARFRALRYRLGRTVWHGIRGGSDNPGWSYGLSNLWKWGANYVSLGMAIPWTMVSLWNDRWREMSYGQQGFEAHAIVRPIVKSFVLFYLVPIMLVAVSVAGLFAQGGWIGNFYFYSEAPPIVTILLFIVIAFSIYWLIGLIFLNYYNTFYREAVARLHFGNLRFRFEATAADWVMLYIVDMLLVIGTLGVGYFFIGYRHWRFFVDHVAIVGDIDPAEIRQSTSKLEKHGEGMLDAIDIGAF